MNDITEKMNKISIDPNMVTPPGSPNVAKCPGAPRSKLNKTPLYIQNLENFGPSPSKVKKSFNKEGHFDLE